MGTRGWIGRDDDETAAGGCGMDGSLVVVWSVVVAVEQAKKKKKTTKKKNKMRNISGIAMIRTGQSRAGNLCRCQRWFLLLAWPVFFFLFWFPVSTTIVISSLSSYIANDTSHNIHTLPTVSPSQHGFSLPVSTRPFIPQIGIRPSRSSFVLFQHLTPVHRSTASWFPHPASETMGRRQ